MPTDINLVATTISILGAVASWAGYLLNRTTALEGSRPELVLTEFAYEPSVSHHRTPSSYSTSTDAARGISFDDVWRWFGLHDQDEIGLCTIKRIKNVGKGVALNVVLTQNLLDEGQSIHFSGLHLPVIAPGESVDLALLGYIWWNKVKQRAEADNTKSAWAAIQLIAWDTRGMRYTFDHGIGCHKGYAYVMSPAGLPQGLTVHRRVGRRSVRMLKLMNRLRKVFTESDKDLIDWPWDRSNHAS